MRQITYTDNEMVWAKPNQFQSVYTERSRFGVSQTTLSSVYLWLGILLLTTGMAHAQVSVSIGLDTAMVLIGDQVGVTVDISAPANTEVKAIQYDAWAESGEAELGLVSTLNTVVKDPLLLQQRTQIQLFDSGYHRFEPLAVIYEWNGQLDTAYSGDLGMQVVTLDVLQEAPLRDNKDNIFERINWRDILPFVLGLLAIALIAYLIWRRSKIVKVVPEPLPPPPVPAHVTALEKLGVLEQEAIWEKGEIKLFQSELTYVLREYLENRFDIPALEATTSEITRALQTTSLPTTQQEELKQILDRADMVKFAKAIPPVDIHPAALAQVRTFVEDTQQVEPEPEPTAEDAEPENEENDA